MSVGALSFRTHKRNVVVKAATKWLGGKACHVVPTCCAHVVGQFSPPKTVWCQFGQFLVQNGTAAQVSEWFDQFRRAHSHASVAFCGVRGHIKSPRPLNLYAHKPLGAGAAPSSSSK